MAEVAGEARGTCAGGLGQVGEASASVLASVRCFAAAINFVVASSSSIVCGTGARETFGVGREFAGTTVTAWRTRAGVDGVFASLATIAVGAGAGEVSASSIACTSV